MRTIKLSGSFLQTDNVDHIELNVNVNIHSNDHFNVGNKTTPTGTYGSVFKNDRVNFTKCISHH